MSRRRLALLLVALFAALALPSSVLVYQAWGQLKWEAFHQHQRLARELSLRIDAEFRQLIEREEARPISDYEFLNVVGGDGSAFLQRSPLSAYPPPADIPGLVGYFQVDAAGRLSTPLLPGERATDYGIAADELAARERLAGQIGGILVENRLAGKRDLAASPEVLEEAFADDRDDAIGFAADAADVASSFANVEVDAEASAPAQTAFDELAAGRLEAPAETVAPRAQVKDLKLEKSYAVTVTEGESEPAGLRQSEAKRSRKEQVRLPAADAPAPARVDEARANVAAGSAVAPPERQLNQRLGRIETFASEVEPMEFALLDSGHFVLFRRVWHRDQRQVQGILIEQREFVDTLIEPAFRQSALASMSRLIVAWRDTILRDFAADYASRYRPSASDTPGELLYQSRLVAPFGDLELIFALARLPVGAGGQVILWSALILALVLVGGFLLLYQLGARQLALARQQQDFVSAVSHELKTPLTSIRMYGEMLREGWADEARRKSYYDFIYHEAERLTRLINNVLQLARLSRNEQRPELETLGVGELVAELEPRLAAQLEPAGFVLALVGDAAADAARIRVDRDGFIQILTNLVDNAVKFSPDAESRRVDLGYRQLGDGRVEFAVRDYGPGIAPDQMKKIFRLFYRAENELTRETVGTGIGLALVRQLADAMGAEVDVVNREPGAEFRLRFDSLPADDS